MTVDELFDLLDCDWDGALSRRDLHRAARRLAWSWPEAPLYAVLDHLTIREPLPKAAFGDVLRQMSGDRYGAYGEVLRKSPLLAMVRSEASERLEQPQPGMDAEPGIGEETSAGLTALLEHLTGVGAADDYRALLDGLEEPRPGISPGDAALLILDPQRSFTAGAWKLSVGADAESEVEPIRLAFEHCGALLDRGRTHIETMFTRCPFPPDSYDWDERIARVVDVSQLYFVKPGNSALWPPTNGFQEWLDDLVQRGKSTLVIGGCTLNSCVRVSAVESQQYAGFRGLQIVVDLHLCGARTSNYLRSPMFGGVSSVESAVREVIAAGVRVAQRVRWRGERQ